MIRYLVPAMGALVGWMVLSASPCEAQVTLLGRMGANGPPASGTGNTSLTQATVGTERASSCHRYQRQIVAALDRYRYENPEVNPGLDTPFLDHLVELGYLAPSNEVRGPGTESGSRYTEVLGEDGLPLPGVCGIRCLQHGSPPEAAACQVPADARTAATPRSGAAADPFR